jgi:hypothetical protein
MGFTPQIKLVALLDSDNSAHLFDAFVPGANIPILGTDWIARMLIADGRAGVWDGRMIHTAGYAGFVLPKIGGIRDPICTP